MVASAMEEEELAEDNKPKPCLTAISLAERLLLIVTATMVRIASTLVYVYMYV